jgi:hypothetical protein
MTRSHPTGRPPVHWAIRAAAYATPLCVLPSALWRLHAALWGNQTCFHGPAWEKAYVVSLSIVSFTAACLTVGLVSRWGEVVPRWTPVVGGRPVNARAATAAAGAGAALIFAVYAYAVLNPIFHWRRPPPVDPACPPPDQTADAWLAYAAYAPLLLWGPLLLLVTVAYHRRRAFAPHP